MTTFLKYGIFMHMKIVKHILQNLSCVVELEVILFNFPLVSTIF